MVLVTQRLDTVGEMSCNPAIGGVGKGTLVREIDALGGLMGLAADAGAIHFTVLNRSRGPAVQGPRVQCDRLAYKKAVQSQLVDMMEGEEETGVRLVSVEASADDLVLDVDEMSGFPRIGGVRLSSGATTATISTNRLVVTTGTFLGGRVHLGLENYPAGRHLENSSGTEPPCSALSETFRSLGLPLSLLNTGTPPRLLGSSIDWDHPALVRQDSDVPPDLEPLSFMTTSGEDLYDSRVRLPPTMQTFTNSATHEMVRGNLDGLPRYSANQGEGHGPILPR